MNDSTKAPPEDEAGTGAPAGETDAYESEWYEVLKRRAEELADEDADENEA